MKSYEQEVVMFERGEEARDCKETVKHVDVACERKARKQGRRKYGNCYHNNRPPSECKTKVEATKTVYLGLFTSRYL